MRRLNTVRERLELLATLLLKTAFALLVGLIVALALVAVGCSGKGYEPWVEPEPHEKNVAMVEDIETLTRGEWVRTAWYRTIEDQILPPTLMIFVARDGRACIVPPKDHTIGLVPGQWYQCSEGWRIASPRNTR